MTGLLFTLPIVVLYAFLGKRMGKSPIKWGLIGFAMLLTVLLIGAVLVKLVNDPIQGMLMWQWMYVASWLTTVGLAFFIAWRKKLIRPQA